MDSNNGGLTCASSRHAPLAALAPRAADAPRRWAAILRNYQNK